MAKVICVCGSGKFAQFIDEITLSETLSGHVVLGFATNSKNIWRMLSIPQKEYLQAMQFEKIDLADEVYFLNVNGYVGDSGKNQLAYTIARGKPLRWVDRQLGEAYMETFRKELGQLVAKFALNLN